MADHKKDPGETKEESPETKTEKKEEEEETTPSEDKEPELKPRRSAASHIIERKDKKIGKLQEKKEAVQDDTGDTPGNGDEDTDTELTPEGRSAIQKEVEKATAPLIAGQRKTADDTEIREVFEAHKDDEVQVPEKILRKYVESPASGTMSVEFIHQGLQNEYAKRAQEKKDAEEDAKGGSLAGTQRRPGAPGKLPDFSKMTDEEFKEWERENNRGE